MVSDFIVIGGGLVGAAVSYGLVKSGASVIMLDEGDTAYRASRGNFGLVWVQSKGDGMHEYASWSRESSDLWVELASLLGEETGINVGHRRPGGLELCLDEDEYKEFESSIARMHNQASVGENGRRMIDGDEVRRLEPNVGPEVVGASFCPHDGMVNPLYTLRALHQQSIKIGVDYRPEHRTFSINAEGGGFRVKTSKGEVLGHKVVLAAGNGNRELGKFVGLNIPVGPERGHIVVTERTKPLFNHVLGQIRQTDEGTVMLGATKENVGFDTGFNFDMAAYVVNRAVRKIPILKNLRFVRSWSALRIMSPDGFPIYQESMEYPGAFVVTCHSGVTLAAVHALRLAPQLIGDNFNDFFAAFSPGRFDVQQIN
ncbi:MAG: FAD-dependent oxidoreductase [Rhodospirillaceae bacterium]|nr:FAD-dependent oxidoreductase [Rhodospirillaceae bacterium]|tara:strand:+ start:1399 stop:2511 length:1113 start_codon:yes stop_codon:yes gene_type:complete